MSQPSKFWDKIAERYAKRPIADEDAYQKKLQVTRDYLRPDMAVLEFGCGTGSTAITHAPYVKHIRAIDISSKMIEIAQGKADANNIKNVTFERSAIDEFSAPDQTLDAVLGLSILHLLDIKDDVISKVYRMLKPGGVFVTSTACLGDTMKWFKPGLFTNPLAVDFSACDASLVAGSFAAGESRVLPQLCDSHLRHERREEAAVEASGTATGDPAVA